VTESNKYRTHKNDELRPEHVGLQVRVSGWVHRKRDHGNLLFIDLRDHYGVTQVVFTPDSDAFKAAEGVKLESVITVSGKVIARTDENINPALPTGRIEVVAEGLEVLSAAEILPFQVAGTQEIPEEQRLRYRFLDLRRDKIHSNVVLRSKVISSIRRRMVEQGFLEYQTPILTSSSPEGARDYLVPSRIHAGKFYALPQAPQQFKQLLMVSGFDRYFQIAPCFRDEDARADRSPGEFYQLDLEMSFVEQDDVFGANRAGALGTLLRVFRLEGDGPAVSAHSVRRGDDCLRQRQARLAQSDPRDRRQRGLPGLGVCGIRQGRWRPGTSCGRFVAPGAA
jgi:aspartyl-tRNA synthetase